MNSRAMRRLAGDHGALHSQPLPPNYLFSPGFSDADDLTQLDILLAGPTHTPFAAGVWKLHLTIPSEYPQQPPTAYFRTSIFHPNVDPQTGAVCVETLKRDWDSKLTLRDVLVTISCLLIHPNPESALNAEAGALIQENYGAFARRAELMTSIHAIVPKALQVAVKEAQERGQQRSEGEQRKDSAAQPDAPMRRRRPTARQRGTAASRTSEGSPSGGVARRRHQQGTSQPFIVQTRNDDVFGTSREQHDQAQATEEDDSSMVDADQENDDSKSPRKATPPKSATPRRPHGIAVPLGELKMEDITSDSDEDGEEPEYPPSPSKSPMKSPSKQRNQIIRDMQHPESSRDAVARAPNITPPSNPDSKPLAEDSPFAGTPSPRKARIRPKSPGSGRAPLFPSLTTPQIYGGVFKARAPSSSEKKREEARRKAELDAKLWELCGKDIKRWNTGDFDEEPFSMKAKRW